MVLETCSTGFSNSCFSTLDRKLSPSNSLCSFLESSALVGFTFLFVVETTFLGAGLEIGASFVFAFLLVTRVFCSISFFLCSSSAFLFASPACLFFSISSKFIVEEVLLVSTDLLSIFSLETVFLVIDTVPLFSCSVLTEVLLRDIVLDDLVCCSFKNSNKVFLS